MAEVIDHLSDGISAEFFIAGNLAHGKVSLGENNTLGVDSDKNVCDLFNIQLMREINDSEIVIFNTFQACDNIGDLRHSLVVSDSVFLAIVDDKAK